MCSTFRILVKMSDVLSGVTAHTLRANVLAYHCSGCDFRCASIFVLLESDNVRIDLRKDEWGVVHEHELSLLDGPDGSGATAVHSWGTDDRRYTIVDDRW